MDVNILLLCLVNHSVYVRSDISDKHFWHNRIWDKLICHIILDTSTFVIIISVELNRFSFTRRKYPVFSFYSYKTVILYKRFLPDRILRCQFNHIISFADKSFYIILIGHKVPNFK